MDRINDTQQRIYEYLMERSQDGVPPSVREIGAAVAVSYTHLRAHETRGNLVCRLLLEKKNFFNDTATTEIYTV